MNLAPEERDVLARELSDAATVLREAREAADPLATLTGMTAAIETLTATQHELVNVLLDRGTAWSVLADALSTSSAGAQRRFPRRSRPQSDQA